MSPRQTARAAALSIAIAVSGAPAIALAQATPSAASAEEADAHFKRGVDLYGETDYRAALIEFKRAYELAPSWKVLFNIGNCHYELQDYVNALRTFERYLAEGGSQVSAERRAAVERDVAKLKGRVARVTIDTEPGVEIAIDDVVVGTTPLAEPILISAGRRKVSAQKAGKVTATRSLDLAGGDSAQVSFELKSAPTGEATPTPGTTGPQRDADAAPPRSAAAVVVPWVATGALTIGAVVTGVLALGASSDLQTKLDTFGVTSDDLTAARGDARGLALATDVLAGAAVVMAGISIYMTATSGSSKTEAPRKTVRIDVGPGSIRAGGTF